MTSALTVFDNLDPPAEVPIRKQRARKLRPEDRIQQWTAGAGLEDFYAYMPTHSYLYVPTRDLWPSSSVNGRISPWPVSSANKRVKPSDWLDRNRPIEQMVWDPNEPMLIRDRVMQVSGYAKQTGATVFNLFRPAEFECGIGAEARPWREHLKRVYPADADHIERYLAYKVQNPGGKINHALVLGGMQGIGKDTLLEPIKAAIGPWNWHDISPGQMLGRFNGWAKCVILRINEARDLGEFDRFALYDHSKTYLAAPPDVVRVDEKHMREHYVANVCGVIITTNHKSDGIYIPADDRRHYVAWSDATREEFDSDYWRKLYAWYRDGGTGHVIAYLLSLDLTTFDPKAPPPKTPAFWAIVHANEAPESGELRDVLDALGRPAAVTAAALIEGANGVRLFDFADELKDRKNRRSMPHKLERVGYVPVRNPDAEDGLFKVAGKRQTVYASKKLSLAEQVKAARAIS